MAVGKASALAAAVVGAMLFGSGVKSDLNTAVAPPLSAPSSAQLVKRLKPLLNNDADERVAATFQNPEDFAAVVHASRNTRVPFAILKQQVVDRNKSLADAIHAAKPDADASLEADLARSEARADLAAIQ